MEDNRTELQKKFEEQTPTIEGVRPKEYLKTYCAWLELQVQKGQSLPIDSVSISMLDYEYEMLIDDEGTPFEINSWIPIATDRIKDRSRIDEYIAKGLIRKRQ